MTENTSAEVIHFPRKISVGSTKDPTEIQQRLYEMKTTCVEDTLGFLLPTFYEAMAEAGFEMLDDRKVKMHEALVRCMLLEHLELPHPMLSFVEDHAVEIDDIIKTEPPIIELDIDELEID